METVRLSRTARIRSGHLWVFSNELATSPKGSEPGSLVELRDREDAFLGIGYINPHSLISVRILTREREEINEDFFRKRILDAFNYRKRFLKDADSFRAVFSEGDFLPGLIVDKFNDCLSVQTLTMGMEIRRDMLIGILDEIFSPSLIVLRNDSPARLLEGLVQEKRVVRGSPEKTAVIREGPLSFTIDLMAGQKTGFFLDQRENRTAFAGLVRGGRGLDLFCYTGSWSAHLAREGAGVTGIDESESAIVSAKRNAEMNGLSGRCSFQRENVFAFLRREVSEKRLYDFVVLDPPAFVKSKALIKGALKAYREINANAMRLLTRGGLLATSSCSYHVDRETFLEMLRSAARDAGRQVRLIEMRSQARDHPVLLSMPETEYLKCAFLEITGTVNRGGVSSRKSNALP